MRVGTFANVAGERFVAEPDGDLARVLEAPDMLAFLAGEGRSRAARRSSSAS